MEWEFRHPTQHNLGRYLYVRNYVNRKQAMQNTVKTERKSDLGHFMTVTHSPLITKWL